MDVLLEAERKKPAGALAYQDSLIRTHVPIAQPNGHDSPGLPLMRPHGMQDDVRGCSRCTWRMRRKARLWLTGFDA